MGTCARLAPAVFGLNANGLAEILVDDADEHKESILRAARACPFVGVEIDGVPLEEKFSDTPVISTRNLTVDVIELRLRCRTLPFVPGQYVFLRMRDKQGEFFRTYSVVEASKGEVALCIKLLPNGRAGAALKDIKPGTVLGLSRAAGLFKLLTNDKPKLFITGGTGVAPVIPMARAAANAQKIIVFGARSESDLFYLDELRAIPNTKLVLIVQNPSPDWKGPTGLVTDVLARSKITRFNEIYTCGSPGMVEAVRQAAIAKEFPEERIFADFFAAAPSASKPAVKIAAPAEDSDTKEETSEAPSEISSARASAKKADRPAESRAPRRSAPAPKTNPAPAPLASRFDVMVAMRQVHYFSSVMVCALILFFAGTGFIANHTDWFIAEESSVSTAGIRALPESANKDEVQPLELCKALFPTALAVEPLPGEDRPSFLVRESESVIHRCEINVENREAQIRPLFALTPTLMTADDKVLMAALVELQGGEINDKSIETGEGTLAFDVESVWHYSNFFVYRTLGFYSVIRTPVPLAKSFSDLHRGKHANFVQSFIMDIASLALVIVALTGTVIGLQVVRRRRSTLIIIAVSCVSLFYLLLHR
jgi:ferredoxin-NADP reductase/ferredoxin